MKISQHFSPRLSQYFIWNHQIPFLHPSAVLPFAAYQIMRLPEPHAQLAKDTLKDPYIFDFLTLDKPFRERELEAGLVGQLD